MNAHTFYSSFLANHLGDYVALRRHLGYELRSQLYVLRQFDRVVEREMTAPGPLTRAVVEAFLRSLAGLQPITRRLRLSTVRQFLLYLRQFEGATLIPERSLEPARSSPRAPYIYTDEEIHALLRAALRYPCRYPARCWLLYRTLIAFLYATGMRISEALALTLGDIDWRHDLMHIRKTKFHKARLVPLTASTCEGLRRYLRARAERGHLTTPEAPLFAQAGGGRLPYRTALGAFRRIALSLTDIDRPSVLEFLQSTECDRRNQPVTRNLRLTAIRAFFRSVANRSPEVVEHGQQILSIPLKRTEQRAVDYLTLEEVKALFAAIPRTSAGSPSAGLPCPAQVRLFGKGAQGATLPSVA